MLVASPVIATSLTLAAGFVLFLALG